MPAAIPALRQAWSALAGYPLLIFFACLFGWSLTSMDQSLFGYAIPGIRAEFGAGIVAASWRLMRNCWPQTQTFCRSWNTSLGMPRGRSISVKSSRMSMRPMNSPSSPASLAMAPTMSAAKGFTPGYLICSTRITSRWHVLGTSISLFGRFIENATSADGWTLLNAANVLSVCSQYLSRLEMERFDARLASDVT